MRADGPPHALVRASTSDLGQGPRALKEDQLRVSVKRDFETGIFCSSDLSGTTAVTSAPECCADPNRSPPPRLPKQLAKACDFSTTESATVIWYGHFVHVDGGNPDVNPES